jgi:hypothetical protein
VGVEAVTRVLRAGALLIACAGVFDPVVALQRRAPLPVELLLPAPHDPTYVEAARLRTSLTASTGEAVDTDSSEPSRAIVAIGNVLPPQEAAVPVFAVDIDSPRVSAIGLEATDAIDGQKQVPLVRFKGHRLKGRSSEFVLRRGEARIAAITHRGSQDEEVFAARFEIVSPDPGLDRLQVRAITQGAAPVTVDVPVVVAPRKLRVLVYEPRPSWAVAFVRQALESDPAFDLRTIANTSRGIATLTARMPASLDGVDANTFDTILAGGLDLLSPGDLEALERFASVRGGTVVLLPDARIPDPLVRALDLPSFEEALLDRPADVKSDVATLRGSELLLPGSREGRYRALATVTHSGAPRAAIIAMTRGAGQIVVSGVLDGWRYRGEKDDAFGQFWRGTVFDAAAAARPRLALDVDPVIAPPGHGIRVRATVRGTEWQRQAGEMRFPALSASLVAADGGTEMIRLLPSAVPGVYEGTVTASEAGRFTVRVQGSDMAMETPVVIDPSAAPVTTDYSSALTRLAAASGGGIFDPEDLQRLASRLEQMEAPMVGQRVHPMRSGWWILPFAALLTAEWTVRRRRGLR